MPRPIEPKGTSAYYGLLAKNNPPETDETDLEAEGLSWYKGNRGKPESDESWTPSPQNVTRQKKSSRRRSRNDKKLKLDAKSYSDESSSDGLSRVVRSKAKRLKKGRAREKNIPLLTTNTKFSSKKQPLKPRLNAPKGDRMAQSNNQNSASSLKLEMEKQMIDEPNCSANIPPVCQRLVNTSLELEKTETRVDGPSYLEEVGPDEETELVSSTDSENELPPVEGPLISTFIAPAQEIGVVESDAEDSDNEVEINKSPIFSSYDSLVKHASSSKSNTEEPMNFEPLITTNYPLERSTTSATSSETDIRGLMNSGPIFTTYYPPVQKTLISASKSENGEDECQLTTWVTPPGNKASESSTESDGEPTLHGPIISTYVEQARTISDDSDSSIVGGPIISTWKDPRATQRRGRKKSKNPKPDESLMISTAKPQTRFQFTNKAVKRLEAEGKTVALKVPKVRRHTQPKERSPKPKRARNPNRPRREYTCSICGKVFNKKFNRDRHVDEYHNSKPMQCAVCSKKLSSQRGWEEHEKNFHNEEHQEFYCIYCGKAFNTINARSMHLLRVCPKNPFPIV